MKRGKINKGEKKVMKLVRLFRVRFLEVLVISIIVVKLALAAFPLLARHDTPIDVVKSSLGVDDAIAEENTAASSSAPGTVLARNDVSGDTNNYLTKKEDLNLLTASGGELDLEKVMEDLVKKEALLKEREKKLEALRTSVEKEIKKLLVIQNEIKAHLEKKVAEREAKSKYLAKMYSSMKAKKAAKLMTELDDDLAVRVLKLMKPEAAGQILTYLDPKKAARLTKEFYYREE